MDGCVPYIIMVFYICSGKVFPLREGVYLVEFHTGLYFMGFLYCVAELVGAAPCGTGIDVPVVPEVPGHARPDLRKHPWSLPGRGEMAVAVASFARLASAFRSVSDAFLLFLV